MTDGIPKPPQGKVEAALVKAASPEGDRVRKAKPGEQDLGSARHHLLFGNRPVRQSGVAVAEAGDGRQHQLRAHMDVLGTPILGDQKYGSVSDLPMDGIEQKLHLHARRLTFERRQTGRNRRYGAIVASHGEDV